MTKFEEYKERSIIVFLVCIIMMVIFIMNQPQDLGYILTAIIGTALISITTFIYYKHKDENC